MQYLEEVDVFSVPVGNLISINKQRKVSSLCGIVCSFIFYALALVAFGFMVSSMNGSDDFFNQAVSWQNLGNPTSQTDIGTDDVIIAFATSRDQSDMLGAFLQGTTQTFQHNVYGIPFTKCSDIYDNNSNIMSLLSPNADDYYCVNSNEVPSVTFSQPNYRRSGFYLMISGCNDMISQYHKMTGESYPGAADITCNDGLPTMLSNVYSTVKVLGK